MIYNVLRYLSVGLLLGWLLMEPPLVQEAGKTEYQVDASAPIERWNQLSAHDTAVECERKKRVELESIIEVVRRASGKTDVSKEPLVVAGFRARCVPAEHLYPPKQPARR